MEENYWSVTRDFLFPVANKVWEVNRALLSCNHFTGRIEFYIATTGEEFRENSELLNCMVSIHYADRLRNTREEILHTWQKLNTKCTRLLSDVSQDDDVAFRKSAIQEYCNAESPDDEIVNERYRLVKSIDDFVIQLDAIADAVRAKWLSDNRIRDCCEYLEGNERELFKLLALDGIGATNPASRLEAELFGDTRTADALRKLAERANIKLEKRKSLLRIDSPHKKRGQEKMYSLQFVRRSQK
jgi:hypothetical protein